MDKTETTFSKRIAALCESRGWTFSGLSLRSGLGKGAVGDLMADTSRAPRRATVDKLAGALGVSSEYLLGESDSDAPVGLRESQLSGGFYEVFVKGGINENGTDGTAFERWTLDRPVPALGIACGADVVVAPRERMSTGDLAVVRRRGELHICYVAEPYLISLSSEGGPTHFLNDNESDVIGSLEFAGISFPGNK